MYNILREFQKREEEDIVSRLWQNEVARQTFERRTDYVREDCITE